MASERLPDHVTAALEVRLPKVTIEYCTQCRWMLRAAYYAQELLSTFGTTIGEISLRPATGGIFTVTIEHPRAEGDLSADGTQHGLTQTTRLWDRKSESGFPETKELKRRLRDVVEPGRDLGHVDKHYGRQAGKQEEATPNSTLESSNAVAGTNASHSLPTAATGKQDGEKCEDCM